MLNLLVICWLGLAALFGGSSKAQNGGMETDTGGYTKDPSVITVSYKDVFNLLANAVFSIDENVNNIELSITLNKRNNDLNIQAFLHTGDGGYKIVKIKP